LKTNKEQANKLLFANIDFSKW